MKKIFIAILAVAALASCAKEEAVRVDRGDAIAFGDAFVDNSTRATTAKDNSYGPSGVMLSAFKVYGAVGGVNIFDGDNVTKGNAAFGEAWTCDGAAQYWVPGASYIFDAVVDATSVTTDANTGLPTSLSYEIATQKDMLYNRVTTIGKPTTNNGIVTFSFTHLLSKVKFAVVNNTPATATDYRYNISNITLTNVYPSGAYAVPAGTWTPATAGIYALGALDVASNSTEYWENEILLIPGTDLGVSCIVNVQIKKGDTWTTISTTTKTFNNVLGTVGTDDTTLAANTAYNLTLTVGLDDTISFSATQLTEWTDAGNVTIQ